MCLSRPPGCHSASIARAVDGQQGSRHADPIFAGSPEIPEIGILLGNVRIRCTTGRPAREKGGSRSDVDTGDNTASSRHRVVAVAIVCALPWRGRGDLLPRGRRTQKCSLRAGRSRQGVLPRLPGDEGMPHVCTRHRPTARRLGCHDTGRTAGTARPVSLGGSVQVARSPRVREWDQSSNYILSELIWCAASRAQVRSYHRSPGRHYGDNGVREEGREHRGGG